MKTSDIGYYVSKLGGCARPLQSGLASHIHMEDKRALPAGFAKGLEDENATALLAQLQESSAGLPRSVAADRRSTLITKTYKREGVSFAFTAYGVRIGVSLEETGLLAEVVNRLPVDWEPAAFDGLDHHYAIDRLERRGERILRRVTDAAGKSFDVNGRAPLIEALESTIEDYVAQYATPWLFLHAGVVGWRGRAIVIPAQSYAGKSTLTAALVAGGAVYYSDEFAVLDPVGRVHAYPRKLSLRTGDQDAWQVRRVEMPGAHERTNGLPPLPVGLVALLSYDPKRGLRTETLDLGAAVMALCEHSVAIRRRPADTLEVMRRVVESATVMRGHRGEASEAADWLLKTADNEQEEPHQPAEQGSGEPA